MNFANPHFFAAVLDGVKHRFVLIQECEALQGSNVHGVPRFSIGANNAVRDPRFSKMNEIVEVGVDASALQIPPEYLMAHQYIYIVHDNTDEQGWQYRSHWSDGEVNEGDEPWTNCPVASSMVRRRIWMTTVVDRLYLTLAKRLLSENIRTDNGGSYKMQGELLRYEKGTLTKSWQKRHVALTSNRLEFYSGSSKKGEIPLNDCEVRMLFESQCPGSKNYAFSIRNPIGNVGILLDAESSEARRSWVLAIQYQLAINSNEFNFPPLEYAPPTGVYPDNRILLCGDLMLQGYDSEKNLMWSPRYFQLLPRELIYYENTILMGRIFIENATINGDNKNLNFSIESNSGIILYLSADTPDTKNLWLLTINKQISHINNQKLLLENIPKEELYEQNNISNSSRKSLYYDNNWNAPPVSGENEEYLTLMYNSPYSNNPLSIEFTEDIPLTTTNTTTTRNEFHAEKKKENSNFTEENIEIKNDNMHSTQEKKESNNNKKTAEVKGFEETSHSFSPDGRMVVSNTISSSKTMSKESSSTSSNATKTYTTSSSSSGGGAIPTFAINAMNASSSNHNRLLNNTNNNTTNSANTNTATATTATPSPVPPALLTGPTSASSISSGSSLDPMALNPRRSLINPKFILTVLKGVTHRFLLSMESETYVPEGARSPSKQNSGSGTTSGGSPVTRFPPRFTVGGPRASKDPRSTPIDELIEITSAKPEIQLPPGWVMMHQYINIVQANTDENGWQYRSDWSDGALSSRDEQWTDRYRAGYHFVRRRLWMTTVVKKNEIMNSKRVVYDSLTAAAKKEVIMQGHLYKYNTELGQSSTSWQRRKVLLYHNKLEFFIGNERKGEVELEGCVVKMLFNSQCPGRNFVFSIRNLNGTVYMLLEAESEEGRLHWVRALQYQIAILTPDVNFAPLVYSPPTGEHPSNRILLCGDLIKDNITIHCQLKCTQLLCYQRDQLYCRLNLDQASLTSAVREDTGFEFAIRFRSGYVLSVTADSSDMKLIWVRAIRRQITRLENERTSSASNNIPSEELIEDGLTPTGRFLRYHDANWTAPPIDLEAEQEFLDMEYENLQQLSRTELWEGELKTISHRGHSGRSVVSNRSNASSGRSSSRSRSRRRADSAEANSSSSASKTTDRSSSRGRSGRDRTSTFSDHRNDRKSGEFTQRAPSNLSTPPGSPTSSASPQKSPYVVSPMSGNHHNNSSNGGGATTTSRVVNTSSSSSSSSSYHQNSTVTSTSNTTKSAVLGSSGIGGSRGEPPLVVSTTFGKKIQPMTIDSDSD